MAGLLTPRRRVPAGKSLLLSLRNVYETFAISAPTVVDAFRGTVSRQVCDDRLEGWAERVVAHAGMTVHVDGRENYDATRTYLVMSNHQSHYDVPVVFAVLGSKVRMIAKRELFDVPVFGGAMRAAGFISIDRNDTKSAIASLGNAREELARGVPIWIAPEGTRSPTGELLPFKKGGFVLALETGLPILPLTIRGTRDALQAKGLRTRPGADVHVTIHPPLDPARYLADAGGDRRIARTRLAEDTRRVIASALGTS